MKTALASACIKCGSQVWYVYKSGRRCVSCAHNRALTARGTIRKLEAEVERLRNAVAEEREACAKEVERARLHMDGSLGLTHKTDFIATRITDFLATRIRARGGE